MGRRGPAKTPTKVLELRGSWRAHRRRGEPEPDRSRPRCPAWLHREAKRAWRELIPRLEEMNVLARCDRNALARYCQLLALWRQANEWIMQHGDIYPDKDSRGRIVGTKEYPQVARAVRLSGELLRLEREFGLTPSARAGLATERSDPDENRGKWLRVMRGA